MLQHRTYRIYIAVILIGLIYIIRLFQIQVIDDKYADIAERISLRKQTVYPQRGLIFDRNDKLIVYNEPVYDLMVSIPLRLKNIDTMGMCDLLAIDLNEFDNRLDHAKRTGYRGKAVFLKNVSRPLYARLQERLYEFKGFFFEIRQDRAYKYNSAAHLLGYLGEVSKKDLDIQEDDYYEQGDFSGKKGVESFYETALRGAKGERYSYIDKFGVNQGSYQDGKLDVEAIDGNNLKLTIDIDLQQYGEKLLTNKKGSVVAIEPKTGEILALISSPFYNPEHFNIQNRRKYYGAALKNPTDPIFNRAVSAPYPPGSTFKPIMALVGLGDGAISAQTHFGCPGHFKLGRRIIRCHAHPFNTSLQRSIASSCNSYYCNTFKNMMQSEKYENTEEAYNSWKAYLQSFGFGGKLGIDVSGERPGWLKDAAFYDKMHGQGRWNYARIISLSFGQGELGLTPVQMANAAAIIANKGYFYTPHVAKEIAGENEIPEEYRSRHQTLVDAQYFEPVIQGMVQVFESGTAAGSAIPGIQMAGKTGTVQNPHGKNHSAFIAFAPVNDPKIAIAVVVEESGYGSTYAAPIASLMMEKYLLPDSACTRQYLADRMMNTYLIPANLRLSNDTTSNAK